MTLVLFYHLVRRKLANRILQFLKLGRDLPESHDVCLGNADPAIKVLYESYPRDCSGLFVECLDVLGVGDNVKDLSCHGYRVWLFGIIEMPATFVLVPEYLVDLGKPLTALDPRFCRSFGRILLHDLESKPVSGIRARRSE